MNNKLLGILGFVSLVFVLGGCASVAADKDGYLNIPAQDFTAQQHLTRHVELNVGDSFSLVLGSNHSTGFSWTENAAITDVSIFTQTNHQYLKDSPQEVIGAPIQEQWSFKALRTGTTRLSLSYDRPWDGGEKASGR